MENENRTYVTIGIAGHTDHGKTTLACLLSNRYDDVYQSVKMPGMTVDSTVLPCSVNDRVDAALIDVPGHHHYLKNAIRGLSSVDISILVVAADDGVMPQTLEHLKLIRCLNIKAGFVVLSKIDMVDEDLVELAVEEIRDALKFTHFEDKPIIPYSSVHATGLDEIITQIEKETIVALPKKVASPFKLWVDKVKQFKGFGTVLTGTVFSGKVSCDQPIYLFPSGIKTRARTLEIHHERRDFAIAGQRTGVNLPNISMDKIKTGMLLTDLSNPPLSRFINIHVSLFKEVKNFQRVRFFTGTAFIKALFVKIETVGHAGESKFFAQLRTEQKRPCFVKDKVILLRLNDNEIIGKGEILEVSPFRYRTSKKEQTVSYLLSVLANRTEDMIRGYLTIHKKDVSSIDEISNYTGVDCQAVLQKMLGKKHLIQVKKGFYLKTEYAHLRKYLVLTFKKILTENPYQNFLNRETLYKSLKHRVSRNLFQSAFSDLVAQHTFIETGANTYELNEFSITLSKDQKAAAILLESFAEKSGLSPFSLNTIYTNVKGRYGYGQVKKMILFLCNEGSIVRIKNDTYLSAGAIADIKERVYKTIKRNGELNLKDSRGILGYGRTKGAFVFEYLDEIGYTARKGNSRFLVDKAV